MARNPAPFRQADIVRLLKALKAVGEQASTIEFDPDGKIIVKIGKPDDAPNKTKEIIL
jgi:hypothetical protein